LPARSRDGAENWFSAEKSPEAAALLSTIFLLNAGIDHTPTVTGLTKSEVGPGLVS
jgi:hypothetical protein